MQAQPSALARWKERWLFAAVAVALVGYVGLWALAHATGPRVGSGQPVAKQTYARASEPEPLPARGTEVFASGEPARYWDGTRGRIWVDPRKVGPEPRDREPAKLTPPPSTVPAPPMLLPLPGPALEFSDGLPRWPEGPPVGRKDTATADEL